MTAIVEEIAAPGTTKRTRKNLIDRISSPPDTEPHDDAEGEI
jgi:hypothetical protein